MSGKNFFLYSLLLSFLINFFLYFIFENKSAIGQGAYCQPLPYLTFSGSWPGQGYLVMTSSTQNVLVRYAGGTLITGSGSANYISKWTSASTLGNSIIYDNGTNVGIGTISPAYKLDVSGDARITGTLYANAISGTYTGTINAANVSSGQFGANTGGGDYYFPGNVGIGTTAPRYKLDVSGDVRFTGTNYVGGHVYVGGYVIITNPDPYVRVDANNKWLVLSGGNGWTPAGATIVLRGVSASYNTGGIEFYGADGTTRNLIISNLNVGIGTTNPGGYKLYVNGPAYINGRISPIDLNTRVINGSYTTLSNEICVKAYDPTGASGTEKCSFGGTCTTGGNIRYVCIMVGP
jgi:hypothetical protein